MTNSLYEHELYMQDLEWVAGLELPWDYLRDKKVLISGATGLIGSFLVDVLMAKNSQGLNCQLFCISRNYDNAMSRFSRWAEDSLLRVIVLDINNPVETLDIGNIDVAIHLASNTHPIQYATDPIGTVLTNIIGLKNMLDFAAANEASRFVFASSNEIYGENRGDRELFAEDYCGYIDCNTLRAGYPESKRCGEALCQAYRSATGLEVVIPRLTRTYGPTLLKADSKAMSQFLKCGVRGSDIVLKSAGTQFYSYTYVADAVSGLLTVLLRGVDGEAYNIADERSDIRLKDLAALIAEASGVDVVFDVPDEIEAAGFSKATKARLDGSKLKEIGWDARYDIEAGVGRTLVMLRECGALL